MKTGVTFLKNSNDFAIQITPFYERFYYIRNMQMSFWRILPIAILMVLVLDISAKISFLTSHFYMKQNLGF